MSKLENTDLTLLLSNLRGEIGRIIETWIFYKDYKNIVSHLSTDNFETDFQNKERNKFIQIKKRFEDDIISGLSELAHKSYGKVNFYFATQKITNFKSEYCEFQKFLDENKIIARRNEYISHKKMPNIKQTSKAEYHIKYSVIIRAIAKAIVLMKMIDLEIYGDISKLQWKKVRKLRYEFNVPLEVNHKLLTFIRKT